MESREINQGFPYSVHPRNVPDTGGTLGLLAFSVLGVVCLAKVRFARARAAN